LNNAIATINALTSFKVDVDNIQKVSDVVKEKIVDKDSKGRGDRKPTPRTPAKKPNPTTNTDEVKTPAKKPIQKKEAKSE
jgi:hypothetical protein